MSPDDVAVVERSWDELRRGRGALVERLARSYGIVSPTCDAEARAGWLCDAVAELVGLLSAPSQLELRARQLADTWPDPDSAPSFRVDGVSLDARGRRGVPDMDRQFRAGMAAGVAAVV